MRNWAPTLPVSTSAVCGPTANVNTGSPDSV
jgi:hypothetical protein